MWGWEHRSRISRERDCAVLGRLLAAVPEMAPGSCRPAPGTGPEPEPMQHVLGAGGEPAGQHGFWDGRGLAAGKDPGAEEREGEKRKRGAGAESDVRYRSGPRRRVPGAPEQDGPSWAMRNDWLKSGFEFLPGAARRWWQPLCSGPRGRAWSVPGGLCGARWARVRRVGLCTAGRDGAAAGSTDVHGASLASGSPEAPLRRLDPNPRGSSAAGSGAAHAKVCFGPPRIAAAAGSAACVRWPEGWWAAGEPPGGRPRVKSTNYDRAAPRCARGGFGTWLPSGPYCAASVVKWYGLRRGPRQGGLWHADHCSGRI